MPYSDEEIDPKLIKKVFTLGVLIVLGFIAFSSPACISASTFTLGVLIVLGLIVLTLSVGCLVTVPAGTVGVQDTFGVVDAKTLEPGLHIKNPFTSVIPMSTRTMKYTDYDKDDKATITALSNDGLSTTMGIAVVYHLVPDKIPELYMNVGTDYENIVMVNPIHSVPRDLISKYDTKTLYSASMEGSTDRARLEQELFNGISQNLNDVGVRDSIVIEQVSIRDINFPDVYTNSIANKMKMDTEIQEKEKEVLKAEQEAKRVAAEAQGIADKARIEAQGMADAAKTLSGVSDSYIKLYFLQTMKENPKAIYIDTENGFPIIKNVDQTT